MRPLRLWVCLCFLVFPLRLSGAEPGDWDGDGRLTIRDVVGFMDGLEAAPGARDGFDHDLDIATLPAGPADLWIRSAYAGLSYLEFFRRSVPDSLPHWTDVIDAWKEPVIQPPLPIDPRMSVSLEAILVPGGVDDRFEMRLNLHTTAPLRAFSILIENPEGVLRVPFDGQGFLEFLDWTSLFLFEVRNRFSLGDLPIAAPHAAFLITNGRYVIQYGLFKDHDGEYTRGFSKTIEPGHYALVLPARLPRETPPGKYRLRILETSEVLFEDQSVWAPSIGPSVDMTVEEVVTAGWDEGVPPMDIDPVERRVLGQIRFRLADAKGDTPADGEPVLVAKPGEDVGVRVQMMTEVPLSTVSYRFHWTSDHLRCTEYGENDVTILFTNPEDNQLYLPAVPNQILCEKGWILSPSHQAEFDLMGDIGESARTYKDRPLEYFKPLSEWRDLTEVKLHINGCAAPGEVMPLTFRRFSMNDPNKGAGAVSGPYAVHHFSDRKAPNWSYDLDYQDGFILVGEGPPRCPEDRPDPGVRFFLGSVSGSRGQEVEIPIRASTEFKSEDIQLALESDPPEVTVESVEMEVMGVLSGETVKHTVLRGQVASLKECEPDCLPMSFLLDDSVEPRFTALFINTRGATEYPGKFEREIGRLRLRIPDDFTGTEIRLKDASFFVHFGALPRSFATGGHHLQDFYPAKEFREGVVTVIPPGQDFLRGDANLDRAVDLSDAIATLAFMFLGGAPLVCEDAADLDDNGALEITDPIFLLGVLFQSSGSIPPPFSGCGPDSGPDGLGCEKASCPQP